MMDNKTYHWRRLDGKESWLSMCNIIKNDELHIAKQLLDRLKLFAGEHPRVKILQEMYDSRNDL